MSTTLWDLDYFGSEFRCERHWNMSDTGNEIVGHPRRDRDTPFQIDGVIVGIVHCRSSRVRVHVDMRRGSDWMVVIVCVKVQKRRLQEAPE